MLDMFYRRDDVWNHVTEKAAIYSTFGICDAIYEFGQKTEEKLKERFERSIKCRVQSVESTACHAEKPCLCRTSFRNHRIWLQ